MKTLCCGKDFKIPKFPVFANHFNKVVQCHHCGTIYEPRRNDETPTRKAELEAMVKGLTEAMRPLLQEWAMLNKEEDKNENERN